MGTYRAEYAAPHTWACTDGTLRGTTIHDTEADAEACAKVKNERLLWDTEQFRTDQRKAWASIERGHLFAEVGL